MHRAFLTAFVLAPLVLSGCDMLGIESASVLAARHEAESRAIGAGCRQAGRSVEQCYFLNRRAEKAAVFAGWKEMNEYMAEHKLEAVPTEPETVETAQAPAEADEPDGRGAARPAAKAAGKGAGTRH